MWRNLPQTLFLLLSKSLSILISQLKVYVKLVLCPSKTSGVRSDLWIATVCVLRAQQKWQSIIKIKPIDLISLYITSKSTLFL